MGSQGSHYHRVEIFPYLLEFIATPTCSTDKINRNQNPRRLGNRIKKERKERKETKEGRYDPNSMVEYTEASVIRVRIAILADAAAYREKEDVGRG